MICHRIPLRQGEAATRAAEAALVDARAAGERAEAERQAQSARRETLARASSAFEHEAGTALAALAGSGSELARTAEAMRQASGEAAARVGEARETSHGAAELVGGVATAANAMKETIGAAVGRVDRAAEIARASLARTEESATVVGALADDARQIGEVVALIQSIAAQTNLLALNATIEAARRGPRLRGGRPGGEEPPARPQCDRADRDAIASVQGRIGSAVDAIGAIETVVRDLNAITGELTASMEAQRAAADDRRLTVRSPTAPPLRAASRPSTRPADVARLAASVSALVETAARQIAELESHVTRFASDARAA
ncbi:MAG: methyl-accepting chemotaxis protein [Xanthobacteraceae bacterium]|nr:methyl-accepting chemotaxis protein [Xanthobacteraceae bacterium]